MVLTVADQDYVEVARSYGASNARIIFRYVLPNAMGPIIVNTTMAISDMILSAAGLSFIGMGIPAAVTGVGRTSFRSADVHFHITLPSGLSGRVHHLEFPFL